jgi:ATP-dependent DNA helicase DinG
MQQTFSLEAAEAMRQAIRAAGGNEVFFRGRTDEERRVVEVEVLARGSREAVPAILQTCRFGDVVIHNHPSGHLVPSAADLEIAARLGALGVGFHLVDNPVDNVYRVVEAFRPQNRHSLAPEKIAELIGPDGSVARALPGFEDRPEQLRMAFAVGEAFNGDRLAVIEAGTGTGKSLAYLVPALLWSLANEERVVVSTNTINLQEQLIRKDLPLLQRATGLEFRAVLVKGRGNYLCRRRLGAAHREPELFESEHRGELDALVDWAGRSAEGSREELTFVPREAVWEEVRCEADQCARVRCADYAACFFHRARRLAAQADLLVVNHALLLADLALRQQTDNYSAAAVLPPFDRIIIDEAHHLEDVATSFFSAQVTRFAYARVLNKLRHPRKLEQGLLPRFLHQLGQQLPDSADVLYRDLHGRVEQLLVERQALLESSAAELDRIGVDLAAVAGRREDEPEELRQRVTAAFAASPAWAATVERVRDLANLTGRFARAGQALLKACDALPEKVADRLASALTDLSGSFLRLEGIAGDLVFFAANEPGTCVWFEIVPPRSGRGGGPVTRLCTAPLEVAESLKVAVYDRFRTVVMTSATLAVGESFAYLKHRVGLDRCPPQRLTELRLPSPFDFARQALLAVPVDIPEPGRPGYPEMLRDLTERAIIAADGRSFVLFTAYAMLRRVHDELAPILAARGYHCLRQGAESRHRLLKTFATDPTSVLFATDSFWEGVDVPGRALEQVIIARLPFKVPTEPILEARAEAIERGGGDPFMEYTVPQAVIKFKQGFGRLIRHREDRGVVLILDARVVKKGYGRIFLRSLPEVRVVAAPSAEVFAEISRFLAGAQAACRTETQGSEA